MSLDVIVKVSERICWQIDSSFWQVKVLWRSQKERPFLIEGSVSLQRPLGDCPSLWRQVQMWRGSTQDNTCWLLMLFLSAGQALQTIMLYAIVTVGHCRMGNQGLSRVPFKTHTPHHYLGSTVQPENGAQQQNIFSPLSRTNIRLDGRKAQAKGSTLAAPPFSARKLLNSVILSEQHRDCILSCRVVVP